MNKIVARLVEGDETLSMLKKLKLDLEENRASTSTHILLGEIKGCRVFRGVAQETEVPEYSDLLRTVLLCTSSGIEKTFFSKTEDDGWRTHHDRNKIKMCALKVMSDLGFGSEGCSTTGKITGVVFSAIDLLNPIIENYNKFSNTLNPIESIVEHLVKIQPGFPKEKPVPYDPFDL